MPNQWTETDDALVGVYLRCEGGADPATNPQAWMDAANAIRTENAEAEVLVLRAAYAQNARHRDGAGNSACVRGGALDWDGDAMTASEYVKRFPEDVTPEELACARYLESRGRHLMIDFGFRDAPRIAAALMEVETWGEPLA